MEDGIRKSGLLTASKVLGIIQAVCLGLCVPIMFLCVVVSLFSMVEFGMFLCLFIWSTVTFILALLGSVYAHKAQKYWCREYATIAGAMFIILSVINLSLFSVLCACFCMSERNKLNQDMNINVRKPIITWSIIGGISTIIMVVAIVLGIAGMASDTYNIMKDYDYSCGMPDGDENLTLNENNEKVDNLNTPKEYLDALEDADFYARNMHYSKAEIVRMLTSTDFGDGYSKEAAEYAVENLVGVNYKENASETAKIYYYDLGIAKEDIRDTLTSEFGDAFTEEEADYAIESLK